MKEANEINANASSLLTNAQNSVVQLDDAISLFSSESQEKIEKAIDDQESQLEEVKKPVEEAQQHADNLTEKVKFKISLRSLLKYWCTRSWVILKDKMHKQTDVSRSLLPTAQQLSPAICKICRE